MHRGAPTLRKKFFEKRGFLLPKKISEFFDGNHPTFLEESLTLFQNMKKIFKKIFFPPHPFHSIGSYSRNVILTVQFGVGAIRDVLS